jgi:hypothetical protein
MNTRERSPMFNGLEYVTTNAYQIPGGILPSGALVRCIDDREERKGELLPPFAVPGAGLGIVMDVMAAAYQAANQLEGIKGMGLDPKELFKTCRTALGGMAVFHTDTVHGTEYACAGCGYCAASLNQPEGNFFSGSAAEFLKWHALEQCQEDMRAKAIDVPTYEGDHVAKAVMVIDALDIGLPSTGVSGDHVYVYHPKARNELLTEVARAVYAQVSKIVPSLDREAWLDLVIGLAQERLTKVMQKLKADKLPMFKVFEKDGVFVVEEMNSVQHQPLEEVAA